jgi:uncharacterized protein YbaP (TraB family)
METDLENLQKQVRNLERLTNTLIALLRDELPQETTNQLINVTRMWATASYPNGKVSA